MFSEMKVVHMVTHAIFAPGYINFMKEEMQEQSHIFVISSISADGKDEKVKGVIDDNNILYWNTPSDVLNGEINTLIKEADKIIITGFFGLELICMNWTPAIWKKVYIQFWGSDFYSLRNKKKSWKEKILVIIKKYCFWKSHALIFLLDGEQKKFKDIVGFEKIYFIAQMPPIKAYREADQSLVPPKNNSLLRVVLGNSASKENHHIEAMELLKKHKRKIDLFCPLVYGDEEYREQVIAYGNRIFENQFHPIIEWMELPEYNYFLSTCDIGIFNNDRQQGLGNIYELLSYGKKVYLNPKTSMWDYFISKGLKVFDINELQTMDSDRLSSMNLSDSEKNKAVDMQNLDTIKEQWTSVFEDI